MSITEFKKEFDPQLLSFLNEKIREAERLADLPEVKGLLEYLTVLLLSGGKRIRPYVLAAMYQTADGKKRKEALKAGFSLEIFHLFALIHDDIMDRSDYRHGVATVHAQVSKQLGEHPDPEHGGVSQAIVIGDLLHSWASENLPSKLQRTYHRMNSEVIIGQMLDVALAYNQQADNEIILRKHELKTARYTFVRPMQMGVELAGGSKELLKFAEDFGTALGLAFQIQDDLIDICTSSFTARKAVLRDLQGGQPTIYSNYVRDRGRPAQQKKLAKYFGRPLTENQHREVAELFVNAGAVRYGETLIDHYCHKAEQCVAMANFSPEDRAVWLGLVSFLRSRQY